MLPPLAARLRGREAAGGGAGLAAKGFTSLELAGVL
jgi:hypothetical protein